MMVKHLVLIISLLMSMSSLAETASTAIGFHETSTSADIVRCRSSATEILDLFIDRYREQIGKCRESSECIYSPGGSGVHVNRQHYQDYRECFLAGNKIADKLCRYGRKGLGEVSGGTGEAWNPGTKPSSYQCIDHQCVPTERVIRHPVRNVNNVKVEVNQEEIGSCRLGIEKILLEKLTNMP